MGIRIEGERVGSGRDWDASTSETGEFDTLIFQGSYKLTARIDNCVFEWTIEGEGLKTSSTEPVLEIGQENEARVTLTLAESPADFCRRIEGIVEGLDGEPVSGIWIATNRVNTIGHAYSGFHSSADGTFGITVREGTYELNAHSDLFSRCEVRGYENSGNNTRARIRVGEEDVRDLRVVVSGAAPPGGPSWTSCWFGE